MDETSSPIIFCARDPRLIEFKWIIGEVVCGRIGNICLKPTQHILGFIQYI